MNNEFPRYVWLHHLIAYARSDHKRNFWREQLDNKVVEPEKWLSSQLVIFMPNIYVIIESLQALSLGQIEEQRVGFIWGFG